MSTSINAQKGRAFLLKMASGASPSNYEVLTGLRATDLTINGNPVDITSKSSNGWREFLPDAGIKQVDITASGLYDANNPRLVQLQEAALAGGQIIDGEVVSGAGDSFQGEWAVESFKRSGTHNDAETFDVTIRSHGEVDYVAA